MSKCKPGWFTPKGGKAHRDSFEDCTAEDKRRAIEGIDGERMIPDCRPLAYANGFDGSTCVYSPTRPPDSECCKKCLKLDEAEKARKEKTDA